MKFIGKLSTYLFVIFYTALSIPTIAADLSGCDDDELYLLRKGGWTSSQIAEQCRPWNLGGNGKECKNGGQVSGMGGDNEHYSETWSGYGFLETIPYFYNGKRFLHFKLNGSPWPTAKWGLSENNWEVICLGESSYVCENGGTVSGKGGDNTTYSESWSGYYGRIELVPYNLNGQSFSHLKLNGKPWPNANWGVSTISFSIHCTGLK